MTNSSSNDLFVYGTLMVPEVLLAVLGRVPVRVEATLEGYRRHAIDGECYPAITVELGAHVRGCLLSGLTQAESMTLDAYEGDAYERTRVELTIDGQHRTVDCYVWRNPRAPRLRDEDWDLETFLSAHIPSYLRALT